MADPVVVDHYRAQVIFHGNSGLPEDVFVNSFVFRNDNNLDRGPQPMHDEVKIELETFYTAQQTNLRRLSEFMAGLAFTRAELKTYDLGQPPGDPLTGTPPRTPISSDLTLAGFSESATLPYEVALTVSWKTAVNAQWGRGRNYIGPLASAAAGPMTEASGPVPHPDLIQTLALAARGLMSGPRTTLVILGKAGPNVVTGGYVDNAWDTQRRRGLAPTARTAI